MKALDAEIDKLRKRLRSLPWQTGRLALVLRFLRTRVQADFTGAMLHDDLARFTGGLLYPFSPWVMKIMFEHGPSFHALALCSDIFERHWSEKPNQAFILETEFFHRSLIYQFVYSHFGHFHATLFGFPARPDGSQVVITVTRQESGGSFSDRHRREIEHICLRMADELSTIQKASLFLPRIAGHEDTIELDRRLRPKSLPLHIQALFALFYGSSTVGPQVYPRLPPMLESEIRTFQEKTKESGRTASNTYPCSFSKLNRGRSLNLRFRTDSEGRAFLDVSEDQSKIEQLRSVIAACRQLPRGQKEPRQVFTTCLMFADGWREDEDLIRMSGLTHLKKGAAMKIITKARSIMLSLPQQPIDLRRSSTRLRK